MSQLQLLICLVLLCLAGGCGASARANAAASLHEGLNLVTDAVDPSYALAVQACDARGQNIIDRAGTSLEEDRTALDQVRERCELVFSRFEELRTAQVAARAAATAFESGDIDFGAALGAVGEVRRLWGLIRDAVEAARPEPATAGGVS